MNKVLSLALISLLFVSCAEEGGQPRKNPLVVQSPIDLKIEGGHANIQIGTPIIVNASLRENAPEFSSIQVFFQDSLYAEKTSFPFSITFPTESMRLGRKTIRVSAVSGERIENRNMTVTLMSDQAAETWSYDVVNTFPHDEKAYTQGLLYAEGFLYEGTGQKGQSSLRKVVPESGDVIQYQDLENNFFGEGICLLNDKIYQLTWSSGTGFVYDRESFSEIARFYYQGEGWGLTTDGEVLYRSDGSYTIYVHHPDDFRLLSSFDVVSDSKLINNLNELEYIDGKIYANIWQSSDIAVIDPSTGRLEARIILKDLLSKKDRDAYTDVLNGIAYDEKTQRLFVTGKYWKKLFEIKVRPNS